MPLIDQSYFVSELNIPNLNRPEIQENIEYLIEKRETELLTDLLGYRLYRDFSNGISITPIVQRWKDLLEGVEYEDSNGMLFKWRGMINISSNGTTKLSLIANYVYYWYMRKEVSQTSGVGEVATKTENSLRVSSDNKMVRAWNEMICWIGELYHFLDARRSVYPELVRACDHKWRTINSGNL